MNARTKVITIRIYAEPNAAPAEQQKHLLPLKTLLELKGIDMSWYDRVKRREQTKRARLQRSQNSAQRRLLDTRR